MGESLDVATRRAHESLQRIVAESQEARNLDTILRNLAKAGAATAIAALLIWLLARIRGLIAKGLAGLGSRHAERLKVGDHVVFGRDQVFMLARFVTIVAFWFLVAFVVYEWLAYTLSLFPWTRPWGEGLLGAAFSLAANIAGAIFESLPNLAVAVTIFWIAWLVSRFVESTLGPFVRGEVESTGSTATRRGPRATCSRWASGSSPSRWPTRTCPARTAKPSRGCRCWSAS